ncbi:hypothetical protein Tco_1533932 [Tanacetum coccineum]
MPNRKKRECGIKLILAPKSAKASFTVKGPIRYGSVKLHRSPSFWGKLLWMTAEHSSLILIKEAAFSCFSLCKRRSFKTLSPLAYKSWPPGMGTCQIRSWKRIQASLIGSLVPCWNRRIKYRRNEGEVKETKPRCILCGSVSFHVIHYTQVMSDVMNRIFAFNPWNVHAPWISQISHAATMFLREDGGLGPESVEDEACHRKGHGGDSKERFTKQREQRKYRLQES